MSRDRTVRRPAAAALVVCCLVAAAAVAGSVGVSPPPAADAQVPDGTAGGTEAEPGASSTETADPAEEADGGEEADGDESAASAAGGDGAGADDGTNADLTRTSYRIEEGTPNETRVSVVDSGRPGPTVLVVGGMHGTERAGSITAEQVANWSIDAGTLVVIPRANAPAVRAGERKMYGTDLNRQFPVGHEPNTSLARAVWGVVERHDPDVVVDLHSSEGIYHPDENRSTGVGQAIFPTVTGTARADADHLAAYMNRTHVPASMPDHRFHRGNTLEGVGVKLVRKVAGDHGGSGFIVETTRVGTTLDQRVAWTTAIVRELLRLHEVVDEPPADVETNGTSDSTDARADRQPFDTPTLDRPAFETTQPVGPR